MVVVVLNKICTFVKSKRFKRNLRLYFFNDKEASIKVLISERFVNPFLERFDTPKMELPRTNTFLMSKENQFVTNSEPAKVTSAQQFQTTYNQIIARYVKLHLAYQHLFSEPVPAEDMAIYNESLKTS